MKTRVRSFALRLADAGTRKALLILAVTSLIIATTGMGLWTHRAYAAKADAEMIATQQAVTLNDVMAKLNRMESEMLEQARTLNTKLKSVELQNTKLAAYVVREHSDTARFELAAEHLGTGQAVRGLYPQISSTVTTPLELETEVCHKTSFSGSAKVSVEPSLDVFGRANVGLDEFGDGVEADAKGQIEAKLGFDLGGDTGFEKNTCLKIAKFNVFGEHPPTVDVGAFINGFTTNAQTLAEKLVQTHSSFPQLSNSAITTGLDTLKNINLSLSPQLALQMLDGPKTAFQTASQDVSNVVNSIPLPGNVLNFFQDPSSLLPSNFDPSTFCSSFTGSGGPISSICGKIPTALADLQGVGNTISNLTNVQTDLANFKSSLSGFCSSVNNGISQINNASIIVPQLASFSYADGLTFQGLKPVLLFKTISIGPQTITNPIKVTPVGCQSL
jgi:hypothetical protein